MTTTKSTPVTGSTPAFEREIIYDRTTRDYAMYLDGELLGFARTYHEAEVTIDQLVFELVAAPYLRETVTPVSTLPQLPSKTVQQSQYADTEFAEATLLKHEACELIKRFSTV